MNEFWVKDELQRLEREYEHSPRSMARWRREWQQLATPRRPATAWLGDRLVGLGERLQGWSVTAQQRALTE